MKTLYYKGKWYYEDSESDVIFAIENNKLVNMYDLTIGNVLHDFYDIDSKIVVENCNNGTNKLLTEVEAFNLIHNF